MFWACVSLLALAGPQVIPFELEGNAIWFEARVNESRPLHMLLDTAAGGCVLNRSRLDELKLPVLFEYDQPNAGSGDNPTRISRIPGLRIGFQGVTLDLPEMAAIPLDEIANAYGTAVDGIVGYPLMERYVLRIDFDARTLTLYDPRQFRHDGGGAVLPLEIRRNVPVVRAKFHLPGTEVIEGEFMVDAPFPDAVLFATPFLRRHDLLNAARKLTPRLISGGRMGVGGRTEELNGRLEWLQLGPYTLKLPTAAYANAKAGAFARTDIAGILGAEVLRRFRVTLDYAHNRMILEPGPHLDDPFEFDASGLAVKAAGPPFRTFEVFRVVEDTPASEAGIRMGDRILEFDGQPAAQLSVSRLRAALRKPHRRYTVKLERGSAPLTVTLNTRPLLPVE